jgi:hypothetical protein
MSANPVTARVIALKPATGTTRVLAVVLLALQAMLWIGGPLVDGANEASSARTQTHVEELGGTKCPRVHSHLDCLICRTLGEGVVTSTPQTLLPSSEKNTGVGFCETSSSLAFRARFGAIGSRAPPRA